MTTGARATLTTDEFDPFVAGLDYPMFVVTTATEGGATRAGCMVGFTTQASIDPPRFLVCLSVKNRTYRVAKDATTLAVHVLDSDDHPLAELFGGTTGDEVDKFARCSWTAGPDGVPLLDDCPRRLVGRVLARHELGDHVGFLLEPFEVQADPQAGPHEEELTFRDVKDVDAGHPA